MNLLEAPMETKSLAPRELLPLPAVQALDENPDLEFTGERMIPGQVEFQLEAEHRARYEFAARNLPKGRVLDDGCGAGYGSMILARNGFEVVGIDIDSQAVTHCQKTCSSPLTSFQQQDSAKLSFTDASFDGVVSFEVIEHIQEYRQYLAEAHRVLRPGGLLIISTPNKSVYTDQSEHHNPFHVHEFYLEEFRKLLKGLFPHVTILGQWNAQGILIGETPTSGSPLAADWLLRESTKPRVLKQARYFVALCRKAEGEAVLGTLANHCFVTDVAVAPMSACAKTQPTATPPQAPLPVQYRQGFYQDEGGWRWMGMNSRLVVPADLTPLRLSFDLTCSSLKFYERLPLELRISRNKVPLRTESFSHDNERRHIEIAIPKSGADVSIEFASSAFFLPAQCGWPGDQRELSIRFANLQLSSPTNPGQVTATVASNSTHTTSVTPDSNPSQLVVALKHEIAVKQAELATYRTWRPPGHFYSPIPDLKEVRQHEQDLFRRHAVDLPGIDLRSAEQVKLLRSLSLFYAEQPFPEKQQPQTRYYFDNPNFGHADALALYCMIRQVRPRRIIEVGSGYSSCVILDTNERFFGGEIDCTFVEPFPELFLSLIKHRRPDPLKLVSSGLQEAELSLFKTLQAGDMLFIDSTHVSKTGSDVNRLLFEVLPVLAPGVHIHFHDIFYPFEYPKEWVYEGRAWNENYILRAFLQYNSLFQIELFNDYLATHQLELLKELMPAWTMNTGASIWLIKLAPDNASVA